MHKLSVKIRIFIKNEKYIAITVYLFATSVYICVLVA